MPVLENEKELENYLLSLPLDDEHPLAGIWVNDLSTIMSQVKIGNYGIIDLLILSFNTSTDTPKPTLEITIVELKKGEIDFNAFGQVCRYKRGMERLLEEHNMTRNVDLNAVLVGRKYAGGDICYAINHCEWLEVYLYDLSLKEGLSFARDWKGWKEVNEEIPKSVPFQEWIDSNKEEAIKSAKEFYEFHNSPDSALPTNF